MTKHHIDPHAVEPGGEQTVAAKTGELLPGPDVCLLGELLREMGIAAHPQAQTVNTAHRGPVDLLESDHIAASGPAHRAVEISVGAHEVSGRGRCGTCQCFHNSCDALPAVMV